MPVSFLWLWSGTHINSLAWYLEEGKWGSVCSPFLHSMPGCAQLSFAKMSPEGRRSAQCCVCSGCGNPFLIQFLAHGQKEKSILEWLLDSKLLSFWNVAQQYGRSLVINLTTDRNTSVGQTISNYYSIIHINNLSCSYPKPNKSFTNKTVMYLSVG